MSDDPEQQLLNAALKYAHAIGLEEHELKRYNGARAYRRECGDELVAALQEVGVTGITLR